MPDLEAKKQHAANSPHHFGAKTLTALFTYTAFITPIMHHMILSAAIKAMPSPKIIEASPIVTVMPGIIKPVGFSPVPYVIIAVFLNTIPLSI